MISRGAPMNDGIKAVIDGGSDVWVRYENTPQTTRMPPKAFDRFGMVIPHCLKSLVMVPTKGLRFIRLSVCEVL